MINLTEDWRAAFPGTCYGVLAMEGLDNREESRVFAERKMAVVKELRERHEGKTRKEIGFEHPFEAYGRYFKRFGQRYPVLHQLETVALKGKGIVSPSPLVAVMYSMELKNGFLTAVHDLDKISLPLTVDVSRGGEAYTDLWGKDKTLPPGDMFLSHQGGILSSILYGPDGESAVTSETSRALFAVYSVPTLRAAEVTAHLEEVEELVILLCPEASRLDLLVVS